MNYPLVKEKVKKTLREQGLTYADLAQKLGLTESGIKKMFQADDISLSRLEQLCEVLGLQIHELLNPGESIDYVPHKLDEKAQAYFTKNRACFDFYFLLMTEPKTLHEIMAEYGIAKNTAYKYLRVLEKFELIQWLPGDKVITNVQGPWLLNFEGDFIRRLVREWALEMVEETLDAYPEPKNFISHRLFYLRPESASELTRAISDLLLEFTRRSHRERKTHRLKVKPVRLLTVCREGQLVSKDRFNETKTSQK